MSIFFDTMFFSASFVWWRYKIVLVFLIYDIWKKPNVLNLQFCKFCPRPLWAPTNVQGCTRGISLDRVYFTVSFCFRRRLSTRWSSWKPLNKNHRYYWSRRAKSPQTPPPSPPQTYRYICELYLLPDSQAGLVPPSLPPSTTESIISDTGLAPPSSTGPPTDSLLRQNILVNYLTVRCL